MTEHETIADLIAWLRRPREGENGYLTAWRDEIADRLEAANKRERGDVAKLREALKYVLQFDATDEAAEEDGLTDAERIAEYADHIEECQKKARAALAEPPRNCEVGV